MCTNCSRYKFTRLTVELTGAAAVNVNDTALTETVNTNLQLQSSLTFQKMTQEVSFPDFESFVLN